MPVFERDSEELRRLLERHSIEGYPVEVPIFGPAKIESQSAAREHIYFKVRPDKPVPFISVVERFNYTDDQMTLAQWEAKYVKESGRTLSFLPWEIRERLEAGGTASQRDWFFQDLLNKGCLDLDQNVTCYSFEYENVWIPPGKLKRGMLVDYEESGEGYGLTKGWAGRVVGFEDDKEVVLLELFAPTPFMRTTPKSIVPQKIRPGFYSSKVGFFGYGLAEGWEDEKGSLPPGKWDEDERQYVLDGVMDLEEIEVFCKEFHPDAPHCVWQGMVMYIIPIRVGIGRFHPLPEAVVDPEVVVEYE